MSSMAGANVCPTVRVKAWNPSQGDYVEINASDFDPARYERWEGLLPPPPAAALPPPPPPKPNALANLPRNWRDGKTAALRELAERVTGRTPETREQAVQMVEAAISKVAANA